MLQACGPAEFHKWVFGVRKCLEQQLVQGNVPSDDMLMQKNTPKARRITKGAFSAQSVDKTRKDGDVSAVANNVSTMQSMSPKNPIINEILTQNLSCADCGQMHPEWVSLNLGVLICIECSGVHRSLGVHLSKVRSLKLDQLSKAEYSLVQGLGNEFVNSVWEDGVINQKGWKKPQPNDTRKVKEEWIKSKYMWKGFLHYDESDGSNQEEREQTYTKDLFEASSKCDVHAAAVALAKGANVNWTNPDEGNKSALQVSIFSGLKDNKDWKGIRTAEILIQNGAKIDSLDQAFFETTLKQSVENDMIEYIMSRIA